MSLNNFYVILSIVILFLILGTLDIFGKKTGKKRFSRVQVVILLAYSYLFIAFADWRFCLFVAVDTVLAYGCAILVERCKNGLRKRNIAIWGGVCLIGILAYFKYTNFFIGSFSKAFGLRVHTIEIILPVGISFFTFSGLSYIIDVYRGKSRAEVNMTDFALYMVFFPKITAGPIVRWDEFRKQVKDYRGIKLDAFQDGLQIFVFGLFKKMVLADHLGVFVDDVFHAPMAYNTGTVILSALSYSLQIYLDFSGYSDIAIGVAKIFGFDFGPNFNLPYIAKGFSDFWNRWHISLSEWFRDYLYIPLGGSRKGEAKAYVNLMVVMLISGLWHGAGWTFVLWGMLHGMASCVTRWMKKMQVQENVWLNMTGIASTFVFSTLFWTVFRSESISQVSVYWRALFTPHTGISQPYTWAFFSIICVVAATVIAVIKSHKNGETYVNSIYPLLDLKKLWPMVIFFTFCGLTILLGYYGNTAFIYSGF